MSYGLDKNNKSGSKHESMNLRAPVLSDQRPLRESSIKKDGRNGDERDSNAAYSNFALTTKFNNALDTEHKNPDITVAN